MKVTLMKTDGYTRNITINSIEEARQIIYDFDYDGDIYQHKLMDGTLILSQEKNDNTFSLFNRQATELAIEMMGISPSSCIKGDAILIADPEEYELLRDYIA